MGSANLNKNEDCLLIDAIAHFNVNCGRNVSLGADHLIPWGGGGGGGRSLGIVFLPKQIIFSLPTRKHKKNIPDKKKNVVSLDVPDKLFFQDMFKDLLSCETGMRGTGTCRPTVASRVQVDGIYISN